MPDILGKRLVKALITEKTLEPLNEYGVSELDLIEDGLRAFKWLMEQIKTGEWPTASMCFELTGISLPDEFEDRLSHIVDLVRKRSLGKAIEKKVRDVAISLESRDPDTALKLLLEGGLSLRKRLTGIKPVSYMDSGPARIEAYGELKKVGGLLGVKTPWASLDTAIQGWVAGSMNVVMAMMNRGKSWFTVIVANDCLLQNKKVLLVTLEMPLKAFQRRLDAVRHKIPFGVLRDAVMDEATELRWKEALTKDLSGEGDILLVDKKLVRRVSDVMALVLEHKPDIVLIDGGYRFEGEPGNKGSKGGWESTVSIVSDLQHAAEITDIPWIITTQMGSAEETGKETRRGKKMNAWNVRYGREWIINPDIVIGMHQDEDLRITNRMQLVLLKVRESTGKSMTDFHIIWDLERMDFRQVPSIGSESSISSEYEVEF